MIKLPSLAQSSQAAARTAETGIGRNNTAAATQSNNVHISIGTGRCGDEACRDRATTTDVHERRYPLLVANQMMMTGGNVFGSHLTTTRQRKLQDTVESAQRASHDPHNASNTKGTMLNTCSQMDVLVVDVNERRV